MKLIFDNTTELVEFLDVMANRAVRHYLDTCFGGDLHTPTPEAQPEDTDDPAPEGEITSSIALTEEPEPDGEHAPRRKRRTKAEMAAAAQTELTAAAQSVGLNTAQSATTGAFIEVAAAQVANQQALIEAQAAAVADVTVTARGTTLSGATLTDAEIMRRAQELGEVDPAKHLNDARAFIAAHGLTAYLQTQQMAKVSENAVTYTPEERARHTAAMQLFEYMKTGEGTAAA